MNRNCKEHAVFGSKKLNRILCHKAIVKAPQSLLYLTIYLAITKMLKNVNIQGESAIKIMPRCTIKLF